MSEHAIEFLKDWIGKKCKAPSQPVRLEKQAEVLAKECAEKAAEVGIPLEDIQEEVGDIQELIVSRLEDAVDAEAAQDNSADFDALPPRAASAGGR
ncbi:hypothetical protein BFN67_19120 [Pseudaminobacter manganicus]|uniref:DUF768 domain-containing protein n=2 Tax=Manganibacter manganicus TaxID=1873176 RepID=A0A1V8RQ22_9HYPH|nr:hypothetical protein BFN67_19120 [Pseudaminobacter manganicus]